MNQNEERLPNQVVGNIGLYYVCYELSKRGWNALPTSRNAKGVDVVIYDKRAKRRFTIQVKALTKATPVPLGNDLSNLISDYFVVCRKVLSERPEIFIAKTSEIRRKIHLGVREGRRSYWLQPKSYEKFRDRWGKIGRGF